MGAIDRRTLLTAAAGGLITTGVRAHAADAPTRQEAEAALQKAVEFFRTRVGIKGGYAWQYSEDLARREGEKQLGPATAWVQPPGTPSVGLAYAGAYEATKIGSYLEALRETAHTLANGQLRSGGWDYRIELDPKARTQQAFRGEPLAPKAANVTTYDDDTTQAALRTLMRADDVLERKDKTVRDAVDFALESVLKAQYPNGAWPQRYNEFPDPKAHPVLQASYPESWSRTFPAVDYKSYYTFNDRNIDRLIDTLLDAAVRYGKPEYRKAVERAGDFILRAQMPDPQPAWSQQYNAEMQPAWARKFEPPSVTGGESQSILRTLMLIARESRQERFLEPIPRALEYLRKSRLADGRMARFYELKTNKPLYFTKDYQLTYDDSDVPTHYAFKVSDTTDRLASEFATLKAKGLPELRPPRAPSPPRMTPELQRQARTVIDSLDARGAWVEDGKLKYHGADDPTRRVITTETFIRNVGILSRFLRASQ